MKKFTYAAIIFILSVIMLFPPAADAATTFKDVPNNHQFKNEIEYLVEIGAISGKGGKFNPDKNVTRGQAAKIIAEALNMPLINPKTPTFSDVSRKHDFYKHIETLAARGIISGSNGRFNPNGTLKRTHMAKIIANGMDLRKQSNKSFSDVSKKSEFYPYIDKLATVGITTGCGGKKFCPNQNVTRGQIAAFISRGLNNWLSSHELVFDRGLKLGMTQEQVIAIEGKPSRRDENTLEYDWVAHSEFGASLLLYFSNNKLDHIIIDWNIEGLKIEDSEEYFTMIVAFIFYEQFGSPKKYVTKWKDQGGYETLYAEWDLGKGTTYRVEMATEPGRKKFYFSTNLFNPNLN